MWQKPRAENDHGHVTWNGHRCRTGPRQIEIMWQSLGWQRRIFIDEMLNSPAARHFRSTWLHGEQSSDQPNNRPTDHFARSLSKSGDSAGDSWSVDLLIRCSDDRSPQRSPNTQVSSFCQMSHRPFKASIPDFETLSRF